MVYRGYACVAVGAREKDEGKPDPHLLGFPLQPLPPRITEIQSENLGFYLSQLGNNCISKTKATFIE